MRRATGQAIVGALFLAGATSAAAACGDASPNASTAAQTASSSSAQSSSSSGAGGVGGAGGAASGGGGAGGFQPGPHEPFPKVSSLGGPVLKAAQIVTITFAGDVNGQTFADYADWIIGSPWLTQVGKDYGVGLGTKGPHVVLNQMAPPTASNLETETLLQGLVTDGTLPMPTADTLYALLYPSTTVISDFADRPNCVIGPDGGTLGGYHWETQAKGAKFPFAVLPTCSISKDAQIYLEVSMSHEFIEAATDPYPLTDPSFGLADSQSGWQTLVGEVGDLCELLTWENDNGHWTQPSWSTSSAALGESPCLPAPKAPYYNASLTPSKIQHVKAGASVDLKVQGWSTGPMSPWALDAQGFGDFNPTLKLSRSTLGNGESATLTITVPKSAKVGSTAGIFLLSTRDQATRDFTFWPTEVVVAP